MYRVCLALLNWLNTLLSGPQAWGKRPLTPVLSSGKVPTTKWALRV